MKIPEKTKVDLVASKEKMRPVINAVNLRITEKVTGRGKSRKVTREGWLEGTDSYRAVIVPVEINADDVAGLIPTAALVAARKERLAEITVNGDVTVPVEGGQLSLVRPAGVFPDMNSINEKAKQEAVVFSVGLSAEMLAGLAKSLGSQHGHVRLDFTSPIKPIRVTPLNHNSDNAEAILMPVRLSS